MKPKETVPSRCRNSAPKAFTLVELLVIVTVLALLALTLLPARAGTRMKSRSIVCLNNLKQLMGAVQMYTHDNHEFFPPNPDDGNTIPGHEWCAGQAGIVGAQEFNPDVLKDPTRCLIAPYLRGDVGVFHCPADPRMGRYQGTNSATAGALVPSARTISMNGGVGTICLCYNNGAGHCGPPNLSVNGPWLRGGGGTRNSPYATFGNSSDFSRVSPSQIFALLDENPWSINDGSFDVIAAMPAWVDWPGTYHDNGGGFAFGDGHAEIHKWKTGSYRLNGPAFRGSTVTTNPDWQWVWTHATVKLY